MYLALIHVLWNKKLIMNTNLWFWLFVLQNCSAWNLGGCWIFKFWATRMVTQKSGAAGEALHTEFPCKRLHLNKTSHPPKTPLNIVPMTHLSGSVCDFRLWQIRGADISACVRVFISNSWFSTIWCHFLRGNVLRVQREARLIPSKSK